MFVFIFQPIRELVLFAIINRAQPMIILVCRCNVDRGGMKHFVSCQGSRVRSRQKDDEQCVSSLSKTGLLKRRSWFSGRPRKLWRESPFARARVRALLISSSHNIDFPGRREGELELRQYKNDSDQSKIMPTLKLPRFFTTYTVWRKARQIQNWNYLWMNGGVLISFLL